MRRCRTRRIYADFIRGFLRGKKRAQMLVGQRYYENRGISSGGRRWAGADGKWVPDEGAQVSRIAHGFVRKLVDQKAQYLFGKPFTIKCEDGAFAGMLNKLFDPALRAAMRGLCKEAVNKGIAWLQVWPEDGEVHFKRIPSEEVVPGLGGWGA